MLKFLGTGSFVCTLMTILHAKRLKVMAFMSQSKRSGISGGHGFTGLLSSEQERPRSTLKKKVLVWSKRIILVLLILVSLLLFNACGLKGGSSLTTEQRADERMAQIMSAVQDKDNEALKALFSKKALGEATDIDNGIDYLFDFIQGNITSWERDAAPADEKTDGGKKSLMIRFVINITTDKDEYQLFVIDYNLDTINPDNEGVYMLEIERAADGNISGLSWQEKLCAGIYRSE